MNKKMCRRVVLLLLVFVCMMSVSAQSVKEVSGDSVVYYTFVKSVDENGAALYLLPEALVSDGYVYNEAAFKVNDVDYVYTNEAKDGVSVLLDNGTVLTLCPSDDSVKFAEGDFLSVEALVDYILEEAVEAVEEEVVETEEIAEAETAAVEDESQKLAGKGGKQAIGFYGQYGIQCLNMADTKYYSDYGFGFGLIYKYRVAKNIALGATLEFTGYSYEEDGFDASTYSALDFMTQLAFVLPLSDSLQLNAAFNPGFEVRSYNGSDTIDPVIGGELYVEYFAAEDACMFFGVRVQGTAENALADGNYYGISYKPYAGLTVDF